MKNPPRLLRRTRTLSVVLVALVAYAVALPSQGQFVTLNSGNSVAQIDPYSQAGMFDWSLGGINQLKKQWFWYRVGTAGPEFSIDTIGGPVVTKLGANTAILRYTANPLFDVSVTYQLLGNSPPGINESIRIINKTSAALDFHFFEYTDFDLLGQVGNQSVELSATAIAARQTMLGSSAFGSESANGNASHREAALFNWTLSRLNDGIATDLNDNLTAGPGDVTFAFQWDWTIPAGGTELISKIKLAHPTRSRESLYNQYTSAWSYEGSRVPR